MPGMFPGEMKLIRQWTENGAFMPIVRKVALDPRSFRGPGPFLKGALRT